MSPGPSRCRAHAPDRSTQLPSPDSLEPWIRCSHTPISLRSKKGQQGQKERRSFIWGHTRSCLFSSFNASNIRSAPGLLLKSFYALSDFVLSSNSPSWRHSSHRTEREAEAQRTSRLPRAVTPEPASAQPQSLCPCHLPLPCWGCRPLSPVRFPSRIPQPPAAGSPASCPTYRPEW